MKNEDGQALAYELFNEPKYNDPSAANRERFAAWLEEKYGDVATLNQVYHSDYADFKAASAFSDSYARDLPGPAVD